MRTFDVTIFGMIYIFIFALMFETSRRCSVILIFLLKVFSKPFIIINMASFFPREPLLKRREIYIYLFILFACSNACINIKWWKCLTVRTQWPQPRGLFHVLENGPYHDFERHLNSIRILKRLILKHLCLAKFRR